MKFNFSFGNKPKTIFRYAMIGLGLSAVVYSLSTCMRVPEILIWDIIDQVNRDHLKNPTLDEFIIKDSNKLNRRIQRDLDRSLQKYIRESQLKDSHVIPPVYSESPIDKSKCYTPECQALGGEIRLCAPWAPDCPIPKIDQEIFRLDDKIGP